MRILISMAGANLEWAGEAEETAVIQLFHPKPMERVQKKMSIPPSSAESLQKYLSSRGFVIEMIYEDVISQAKTTFWKHLLVNGPKQIPRAEFDRFVQEVGLPLREIQTEALFKILNSGLAVNASICGTGKTLTTLLHSFFFFKRDKKSLTIIASPVSCMSEYKKEIQAYRGYFEDMSLEEIYGDSVADMREKLAASNSNVLIISLNSIEKLAGEIQDKISNNEGQVNFVIEEGHNIKEVNSGRSKGAQLVAPLAERVIVNTATPMPKGPSDIRGILSLVGIPQPIDTYTSGIPERDLEVLKGVTFVSDETDIPFAPVKTEHLDYRDLSDLTQRMFEVVSAELQLGHKVVIFCSTNAGLRNVWSSFPEVKKTVLSGSYYVDTCTDSELKTGRSYDGQQNAIKEFNFDEGCKLLVANYKVGSVGVNLQHSGARLAFFFEISNNGADFFQARYRIRRPFVFPEKGFVYYFARSSDARKRRTEDRQFAKIANQQAVLQDIKRQTRSAQ